MHLLRNSMDYAGWKDRKPVVTALKAVYRAPDAAAAATALSEFEDGAWGRKYPAITKGMSAFDLSDRIHEFHNGAPRALYGRYTALDPATAAALPQCAAPSTGRAHYPLRS